MTNLEELEQTRAKLEERKSSFAAKRDDVINHEAYKREGAALLETMANAYEESMHERFPGVGDNDTRALKDSSAKGYAQAKFAFNKHYAEHLLDFDRTDALKRSPMEYGGRCSELVRTAMLALPERTAEAIDVIKNSALKCISDLNQREAASCMVGVARAFCEIAQKRPDLQPQLREAVQSIISADKKAETMGPADNLKYGINRAGMGTRLLPSTTNLSSLALGSRSGARE